ncbi:MAG TPA: ATP-binding cassette domain-containing protein [Chitinophaga sp.]|uniref:ABC transporter ATP-binding protein n=1 Tax=Chitinophaga sp. TaxID=1869181 RepID=UPI002B90DC50|nr:ATP-binding cassette domain-containing protein [Chitinophaga sp.]HVI48743.1 ATP-binding cassette domain-containing protein [Chitinophaga sp.]
MIEAIALTKRYNGHTALDDLHLSVPAGETFCLLGQNGAGKTTTINLFLGFLKATSGKAFINGKEVNPDDAETRQHIAYIPEVVMLYSYLTSIENLDFFSRIAGYKYSRQQLETFLIRAGLQPNAFHKPVGNHSKGMRQKVGIAIALAKNAGVIFMDEPTSGLDPKATSEFNEIVQSLSRQGKAIFMATHDIFNAVTIATRIGIMKQGKLVHIIEARSINAEDLQKLYLETI